MATFFLSAFFAARFYVFGGGVTGLSSTGGNAYRLEFPGAVSESHVSHAAGGLQCPSRCLMAVDSSGAQSLWSCIGSEQGDATVQQWSDQEIAFRRERYQALRSEWAGTVKKSAAERTAEIRPGLIGIEQPLDDFLAGRTTAFEFREAIKSDLHANDTGFSGPAGLMFFNQLVNDSEASDLDSVLRDVLRVPTGIEQAVTAIDRLAAFTTVLREQGSGAAVARVAFFASWFWWVQDPAWQPIWPRTEKGLAKLGWILGSNPDHGDR